MAKSKKHIEIVRSTTRGLSSLSQESSDAITKVLKKHFSKVGVTIVNTLSDLEALVEMKPDLVFLGMEFVPLDPVLGIDDPNKIWLSDFLDAHEITYTGSSQLAHELERNKPLAKQRARDAGLKTARFYVVRQNKIIGQEYISLNFPLFLKPANRGGGLGIDSESVVYNSEQLRTKAESVRTTFRSDVLIEEYLPGREFSVAILKKEDSSDFLVMPIELIAPADSSGIRVLSGEVKSSNAEQAIKVMDKTMREPITTLALEVFKALGARDYGRIDIRLDAEGTPHFLEANLIPSLISGYGSFPKACVLNAGLTYEPMILQIVNLGLARSLRAIEEVLDAVTLHTPLLPVPEIAFKQV